MIIIIIIKSSSTTGFVKCIESCTRFWHPCMNGQTRMRLFVYGLLFNRPCDSKFNRHSNQSVIYITYIEAVKRRGYRPKLVKEMTTSFFPFVVRAYNIQHLKGFIKQTGPSQTHKFNGPRCCDSSALLYIQSS